MNNTEKILEHLAQSGKPGADKLDKRAAMDAKTVQLIAQLTTRIDALRVQSSDLSSQVEALQELLRRRNAEIGILNIAFNGAPKLIH